MAFFQLPGKKLRDAASAGDLEELNRIIGKGVDINDRSASTGATALFEAVAHDNVHIINALLGSGADANIEDLWGESPLSYAAARGQAKIVNILMNCQDFKRLTKKKIHAAFFSAAKNGHTETALLFLSRGTDVNYMDVNDDEGSALHAAAANGHAQTVSALLGSGARVNQRRIKTAYNMDGTVAIMHGATPLHDAAENGHTEVVKILLQKGADISLLDIDGKTPGMLVCAKYTNKANLAKVAGEIRTLLTLGSTLNTNSMYGKMKMVAEVKPPVTKELDTAANDVLRVLDQNTKGGAPAKKEQGGKKQAPAKGEEKEAAKAPSATHPFLIPRSKVKLPDAKVKALCATAAYGESVEGELEKKKVLVKLFNYKELGTVDEKEAIKEALQLQSANSPYVARFLGILEDKSTAKDSCLQGSLVTEWGEGGSLYHWLQGTGATVSFKQRIEMALQVAAGLKYLHDQQMVHGDLRPQNVVVQPGKEGTTPMVKVSGYCLNFHSSCAMMAPHLTHQPGCLEHRSPERLTSTFQCSVQDDIYAFGILLHFIATSLPPYPRYRADELEKAICRGLRPSLKEWTMAQSAGDQQVAHAYLKLAEACWGFHTWHRPQLSNIVERLQGMVVLLTR